MAKNYLTCWEEDGIKRWEMTKEEDNNTLLLNLLTNEKVDNHTIFIIPTNFISGIWLTPDTHKSQRVDFWNFYKDYGTSYIKPTTTEENQKITEEINEKRGNNTKYGWISPEGKYFHCGYQGHTALADRICFGMINTDNAERYLEEHGWCKIYKSIFDDVYSVYVGGRHTVTDAQMKTLIKLELDNAENLSNMLCKDR